jgi:hypothetical protein
MGTCPFHPIPHLSTMRTSAPLSLAFSAAHMPAPPAPSTKTSLVITVRAIVESLIAVPSLVW